MHAQITASELPLFEDWEGGTARDILKDFEAPADALDGATIIAAEYTYGSYEGSATVLYERGGKLFEVTGGHCSCYGLEGQWAPVEIPPQYLVRRTEKGRYGEGSGFRHAVRAYLAAYSAAA